MSLLCVPCQGDEHWDCDGDFHPVVGSTCCCATCKAYLDEHGPFSVFPRPQKRLHRTIEHQKARGRA